MAESLLFGVAESFIEKLASVAVEKASLTLGVYDNLQEIKNTVSLIKAVLLDAEQTQWQNHELREWLKQIKRVFYDAEDVIDDFECEALRKHIINTSGSIRRKVKRFFSNSNPLVYRLKMVHQIKHIKERFDKVAADRLKFGLQINDSDNRVVKRRELTHSYVNDSDVIGRKHDKQKIINQLLLDSGDSNSLSVIPIVGIGGLGKTTLSKAVFNDKSLDETFSLKMWVCVSDDFGLKNLLLKILNAASVSGSATGPNPIHQANYTNHDLNQLQNHLRNEIAGKKFLLVLDDVWNQDRVKWVELKNLIQVGAEGSKVLVTTRSHSIAKMMGTNTSYILELKGLSPEDSLSVFIKWAFKEGEEKNYPELMKIGKEIVQKCGGLPLALRTSGSSLFLKVDVEEWKFIRDSEIWNLPQKEDDILPAIKLSYDQLPSYLKRCFTCFSLFQKDFTFTNMDVRMLWEVLGVLLPPNRGKTLEGTSIQLLQELWSRSFLQDFVDFGGGICTFKLHDLVHDLAVYVARDEFQLIEFHNENILENVLHLSFIKNDLLGVTPVPTGLRTMLFPEEANDKAFLKTLASRCKFLRLLQLADSKYESLPRSIGKLKHLRYLNLKNSKELKSLPNSLCKLQNLHTLDLDGCIELQTLPNGIGNLISLRQLVITTKQYTLPEKEIAKLTSLERFDVTYCDNLETLLFEGIQLSNLKSLYIHSCGNLKSMPLHVIPNLEWLFITNCHKLKLSFHNDNQIPKFKLKLLTLRSLPQLVSIPKWLQECADTLQTLAIVDCENIDELPEWLSTLICLNKLVIVNCPKLLSLPDDIDCLPKLEDLSIYDCPELCRRYQAGVGRDWHKISHIKQVKFHCL
ncbi:putative P-loop containing nucleoside triphosphate hydrolase, leucine-rich repeat domain, L [Medicago truncatula]|uniref:NBS-LRR type disease resistance protein n=1 Tax=Medicago truncatula TaxID=3880 RepID=G7KFT8_MEDTR|nr:putative disease resistance protein RGA1 [Medicago truncatula]AES99125.1 NBS-LRR type disease resistance protein [Medicago truncatula]RHN56834.1 putative P-loop containing nucleoside triphosphate hydrolase, leucine-rich repeat domain, L [Medicago truncatula]